MVYKDDMWGFRRELLHLSSMSVHKIAVKPKTY